MVSPLFKQSLPVLTHLLTLNFHRAISVFCLSLNYSLLDPLDQLGISLNFALAYSFMSSAFQLIFQGGRPFTHIHHFGLHAPIYYGKYKGYWRTIHHFRSPETIYYSIFRFNVLIMWFSGALIITTAHTKST